METSPQPERIGSRFITYVNEVINPPASTAPARSILQARQIVALVGIVATLIQIVIWLLIAILGGQLDSPWWLCTAIPAAGLVAALTLIKRTSDDTR